MFLKKKLILNTRLISDENTRREVAAAGKSRATTTSNTWVRTFVLNYVIPRRFRFSWKKFTKTEKLKANNTNLYVASESISFWCKRLVDHCGIMEHLQTICVRIMMILRIDILKFIDRVAVSHKILFTIIVIENCLTSDNVNTFKYSVHFDTCHDKIKSSQFFVVNSNEIVLELDYAHFKRSVQSNQNLNYIRIK